MAQESSIELGSWGWRQGLQRVDWMVLIDMFGWGDQGTLLCCAVSSALTFKYFQRTLSRTTRPFWGANEREMGIFDERTYNRQSVRKYARRCQEGRNCDRIRFGSAERTDSGGIIICDNRWQASSRPSTTALMRFKCGAVGLPAMSAIFS